MNDTPPDVLTVAELQRLLTQAEPAALLVPPRILRRVIKRDRELAGMGLQVPHRKSYVVNRDRLRSIAAADELGLEPNRDLPPTVILLPRPEWQRLNSHDRAKALRSYWRLLFHARIHVALQARSGDGLPSRIHRIGLTEFEEATAVLRQENYLLPPGDPATVYEEFAAVYLELRFFEPHLLPLYFPACLHRETIDAVLAEDVDAAGLFAATRLHGAADPDPPQRAESVSDGEETDADASGSLRADDAPRAYRRLLQLADKFSARGNMVRAAIFRMRAVRLAPLGQINPTRAAAHREMERFSQRLQKALGYADETAGDWRQGLFALLEPASQGIWPRASRMLYDLQKACLDHERPVYAVDLIEWIVSWGRRSIKRLLPFHDSVRLVKHLRSALHRLTAIRISEPIHRRLRELLIESTHQTTHRLRQRLRPVIAAALNKVGLTPHNIAEEVARDKVVEELIDLVVEHGFLGMSDLRDAIARNRLKLPDLTDAEASGGSYAPGKVEASGGSYAPGKVEASGGSYAPGKVEASGGSYAPGSRNRGHNCPRSPLRRGLARIGRGIQTFFLGDSLIRANRQLASDLDGVYHRGEIYLRWLQRLSAAAFGTHVGRFLTLYLALPFGCSLAVLKVWDEVMEYIPGGTPESGINPYAFTLLGLFFLALFHIAPFRRILMGASLKAWHGLHWLGHDLPAWILRLPWVARILQSKPWLFLFQFVLKPLPGAVLCALVLRYFGYCLPVYLTAGAGVFAAGGLLLNSRWGAYVEEAATDQLMRTWQLLHADLLPGLVRWVIYLYRRLQEEMERLIYTVDEWLRFRPGDNRLSLVVKPVLGLIWFGITYLFRVIFNLFVEPTFNPIKHFPTVTVTAKLLLPAYPALLHTFRAPVEPLLGKALGNTVAATAIGLVPGLAGFLVWELKENWRLYRANQSPTLRPEIVGHHGETVLRLMRPGFHSGTLPKLFARLRHGRGRSPHKQFETLHHLRERLRHFIGRNLFAVLSGSKSWGDALSLRVGEIHIATNRIRMELTGPAASIHIDFEEHGGRLFAGLTCPAAGQETWLSQRTPEARLAFRDALGGFYELAGVEVVREQSEAPLPPIHWEDWVQTWQRDHDGKGHVPLLPLPISPGHCI